METKEKTAITIQTTVKAPVEKVWKYFSEPDHVTKWAQASDDWHAPYADNDLREGGQFKTTMAAKDGSFSFDFGGTYSEVIDRKRLAYQMSDERKVEVDFVPVEGGVKVMEKFDPEESNPIEMQRGGWQAILDNFKKYTEANSQ